MSKMFFRLFLLLFLSNFLLAETGGKIKIYQTACVDLEKILTLIEKDDEFKSNFEAYQYEQYTRAEKIKTTIRELEDYLRDNVDFSSSKKKEILDDIAFQKSALASIIGEGEFTDEKSENETFLMLYQIIEKIALREGFSMVIEKQSAVLYAADEVDLTERVIAQIRSQLLE